MSQKIAIIFLDLLKSVTQDLVQKTRMQLLHVTSNQISCSTLVMYPSSLSVLDNGEKSCKFQKESISINHTNLSRVCQIIKNCCESC